MKKFIGTALLAGSLILMPVMGHADGNAPSEISVVLDGQLQSYSVSPVIEQGNTLVPMRPIFEALGAEIEWDEKTKTVMAVKDGEKVAVKIGSYFAQLNGDTVKLPVQPKIVSETTMVPLRFISESLGAQVDWDGLTKTVTINTAVKQTNNNMEEITEHIVIEGSLTYEQAVAQAKAHSYDLKAAKEKVERAEATRGQASDNLSYAPVGFGNTPDDAMSRGALMNLKAEDANWQMVRRQVELTEEKIQYQVLNAFNEVIAKEDAVRLADKRIKDAQGKLGIVSVKERHQMASETELLLARETLKEEQHKKEALLKEMADAHIKLNKLVGAKADQRHQLAKEVGWEPLGKVDLDSHVARVLARNPYLWFQELSIRLQQLGVDLYTFNVGDIPIQARESDVKTAEYELENMKQQMDQSIRSIYNQMGQMEENLAVLESNLAKAQQALKVTRAQYHVGMAIQADLLAAELLVADLENKKLSLILGYEQLKEVFHKPWIAM